MNISAARVSRPHRMAAVVFVALGLLAALTIPATKADAQVVTELSCYRSFKSRCLADSARPIRFGPARYWDFVAPYGWVTGSASMSKPRDINAARWELDPERKGAHRVVCFIARNGRANARYKIYVDDELQSVTAVDQSDFRDKWVILKTFRVPSSRSNVEVYLGDRAPGPAGRDMYMGNCALYFGAHTLDLSGGRVQPTPTPRPISPPPTRPTPAPTSRPAVTPTRPEITYWHYGSGNRARCRQILNRDDVFGIVITIDYRDRDATMGVNVPVTFRLGRNGAIPTKRETYAVRDGNNSSGRVRALWCLWGRVDSYRVTHIEVTDSTGLTSYAANAQG